MVEDIKVLLRERMAARVHGVWAKWLNYMFNKGVFKEDGSWVLPREYVDRWTTQMNKKYEELNDIEKEGNRRIADQYIAVFWLVQGRERKNK